MPWSFRQLSPRMNSAFRRNKFVKLRIILRFENRRGRRRNGEMKDLQSVMAALALALAGAGVSLFSSCSSLERTVVAPPQIPGAHYVGNRVCADCHTNIARIFPASPHAGFYKDDLKWAAMTGCESCHGPGSEHVRVGGGRGKSIVNPGKDPAACFECHLETHAQFGLPQHHPVMEGRMSCVQCHDPHGRSSSTRRSAKAARSAIHPTVRSTRRCSSNATSTCA